jgi:excisionase family DNA binding protein
MSARASSEAARLLTAEQVAARWQVPKSVVYRLTREAKLPTVQLGRYYRYSIAALEAFESDGGAHA